MSQTSLLGRQHTRLGRQQTRLPHHFQHVEHVPLFTNLAAFEAEDRHPVCRDPLARCRKPHPSLGVRTTHSNMHGYQVPLCDHPVHPEAHVRQSLAFSPGIGQILLKCESAVAAMAHKILRMKLPVLVEDLAYARGERKALPDMS